MNRTNSCDSPGPTRVGRCVPVALMEQMEPRLLLSNPAPLPSLADFEDPTNPAMRLTTAFGDIDFELLANEVPDLVTAFIAGLERGFTCDQTFFHRLIPGVVLQGGVFGYSPDAGINAIPVNLPVDNPVGTGRANTERTVAIGVLNDSFGTLSTSSFIINLTDNSGLYDPAQAVVYARVIDDRSWGVVQMIASLDTADLTHDTGFAGFFAGSFIEVPVTAPYTPPSDGMGGTPITSELLASTYDLAILKAPGAPDFYRDSLYEPEGFLHSSVEEFVPIENPNDEPVYFELNARFEPGTRLNALIRDDVVTRGMIPAHSRGGVTLRIGASTVDNAVRDQNRPFALELRSTLPLAASLSHYDFGSTLSMEFEEQLATTWFFPRAVKQDLVNDFLVWYNPGNENTTVSVTLIEEDGTARDPIIIETARFTRGGINLQTSGDIPDGVFAVRIESTQPISVSRSHYADSGPPRSRPEGYAEAGATGEPSAVGIVAWGADPGETPAPGDAPTITLSFFNPGTEDAVVRVDLYAEGETEPVMSFPAAVVVAAGRTGVFDRALPQGMMDVYSIAYSASAPVYAEYEVRRSEGNYGGAVPISAANDYHFAEGFTDPSRAEPNVLEESLHLFNRNGPAFGVPEADADVRITFRFTDGFELSIDRAVAAGTLMRVSISSLDEILAQGVEHGRYFYSVEVESDVPIVAQMLHTDVSLGTSGLGGGGFILPGTTFGESRRLDDTGQR